MTVQYSIQRMVSDGTLSTIALGIQYLQRNDIYIRIAGEETPQSGAPSGYTWSFLDNTTLKILPAVPNGVEVVVYRRTDVDAMYNIYSQNAQFDEATIDENNQQLLYIAQEYLEQGLPGAGVDSLEYVNTVAGINYYRFKLTDGSYTPTFGVPDGTVELRGDLLDSPLRLQGTRFALRDVYSARDFSDIVGDGVADDTVALQAAIDSVPSGGSFGFIGGKFLFNKLIISKPVVLFGDAELVHNGFRIKSSMVTSLLSGRQICRNYQSSSRAFQVIAYEDGADYDDIKILFNRFEGFFYSTDMRGRGYSVAPSDPTNRVLKNTLIMGCTSVAPSGVNAGHFQHTGVTNAKVIGCSAYGGRNATSYNFINGNGFIIVQGCYDQNNEYGSLEIENNLVSHAVVSGNVFGKQLWIDDTSNVTVSGNTVTDRIFITAQSNDTDNITITGNTCSKVSVTKFGESPTGRHKGVHIVANTTYGDGGTYEVFIDGSVDRVTIENNSMNGSAANAIAIVRSANCNHMVRNNRSRTARPLVISGVGGRVIGYGNDNMTVSGTYDSKHISNMMVPSSAYLDLPGKYLHGTKYTGSIAPLDTAGVILPIPNSGSLALRGVSVWVLIRDPSTNDTSCYRVDGIYRVIGASVHLTFGTPYSAFGVDTASITLTNNTSVADSINILVTNSHATKTLQVTVMPEVSSRLGAEE